MSREQGITAKKFENFSEWYTQVIQKADLADYTDVSGVIVFKPRIYSVWEKVQDFFNKEIKKLGVKNAYFPLFIPEKLLTKESEHVEGFTPEVAWVTQGGNTKLTERLAIRPTSETIIYDSYSKWIRSYNDLPLKINQWCNVVRWEFKHAVPFLRTREFLWQEGHTVFATKEEAEEEVLEILHLYEKLFKELYAVPLLLGKKTELEKFPGAEYTLSIESFLPNGKIAQAGTSHYLGQHFSKPFNIKFKDKDEQEKYVHQNSWGTSTRGLGVMIAIHSDDNGLILPPAVAENKIVIIPILFDDSKEKVLKVAKELMKELKSFDPIIDDDASKRPGWKFAQYELIGIPLRIEIGPKDLEKNSVMITRRDTREKISSSLKELPNKIESILKQMQKDLYEKALENLNNSIIKTDNYNDLKNAKDKLYLVDFCLEKSCEEKLKEETGLKSINIPLKQKKFTNEKCLRCGNKATAQVYFGKTY